MTNNNQTSTLTTLGRRRLMVVDDDRDVQALIQNALSKDFDLKLVSSGSEVQTAAQSFRPELILLDVNMPNIDGFEVMRLISSSPVTAGVPVIGMSADADEVTRKRMFDLGVIGFVRKPIDPKGLSKDIQAMDEGMNSVAASVSGNRRFTIAFNSSEKQRYIRQRIHEYLEKSLDITVVLMTLDQGDQFRSDSNLLAWMNQQRLILLQVNPSLIAQFPYIQDLSPILADLRGFIDDLPSDQLVLMFDEFHLFINVRDSKATVARIHQVREDFSKICKAMEFFSARSINEDEMRVIRTFSDVISR